MHPSGVSPVAFFGGHNSRLRGEQAVIWGEQPRSIPRAAGPAAVPV